MNKKNNEPSVAARVKQQRLQDQGLQILFGVVNLVDESKHLQNF